MATVDDLLADIQIRTPGVVADMAKRELLLTVIDFRAEVQGLAPPASDVDPATWLSDADYIANYLLLLHGTLARLLAQSGKPYFSLELAAVHNQVYSDLVIKARGTAQADPTTGIERVLNSARAQLPGTRDAVLELEFVAILDEFLNTTNAWSEEVQFNTVAGTISYTLTPTAGRITRLLAVTDDPASELDRRPIKADMPTPGELRLGWSPTVVEPLVATFGLSIAVNDTVAAIDVPVWILNQYHLALLHGVLSRMQMQNAKPYSSERMAIYNGRKFRSLMATARAERQQAFKFRQQPWTFPQGFARMRG